MEETKTWTTVSLSSNKNTLGSKCILQIKKISDGTIESYKACLVAEGFNQQEFIDFLDIYYPLAKLVTVKMLLSLVVQRSWPVIQLDINNAFLNRELDKEVYMKLPQGINVIMLIPRINKWCISCKNHYMV